jgi:hypothetical protein
LLWWSSEVIYDYMIVGAGSAGSAYRSCPRAYNVRPMIMSAHSVRPGSRSRMARGQNAVVVASLVRRGVPRVTIPRPARTSPRPTSYVNSSLLTMWSDTQAGTSTISTVTNKASGMSNGSGTLAVISCRSSSSVAHEVLDSRGNFVRRLKLT